MLVIFYWCNQPQTASSNKTNNWTNDSTTHFILYAQKGGRSENHLAAIGQQLEDTQEELLHLLNETMPQHLHIYFKKTGKH